MKTLSVIIPVYNEKNTLSNILNAVEAVKLGKDFKKEIILVDDGSTDGTRDLLKEYEEKYKVLYHPHNLGKGAAVRNGFSHATGEISIIQDADLEYDPQEYPKLLKPILDGKADVVYGSRFIGSDAHRIHLFWHYLGNRTLTMFSNMLTNLNLSDMETCYKMLTKEALQKITPQLSSNRFGLEPEITARVAQSRLRIYEVGISYSGRTYAEGKKINWKDGIAAFWHIIKFNLFQ